MQNKGMIFKNI